MNINLRLTYQVGCEWSEQQNSISTGKGQWDSKQLDLHGTQLFKNLWISLFQPYSKFSSTSSKLDALKDLKALISSESTRFIIP